jgi:antitoxin component YwqK of YwqJK toxin-antitoxin module
MLGGEMHGYWEWFRKDGTRMRSGHFDRGVQVGEWTTYDAKGNVYKVTRMKAKGGA